MSGTQETKGGVRGSVSRYHGPVQKKAYSLGSTKRVTVLADDREKTAFYALRSIGLGRARLVFEEAFRAGTEDERIENIEALMNVRGDAQKARVEQQSGRSLSTEQAAERLGISSEAVRKRVDTGSMIGYVVPGDERNRIRLPEWQFVGAKSLHPWIRSVVDAYGANGWAILDFLTTPLNGKVADREVQGESLLDHLLKGEADFVLEAARRANPE